MRLFGRSVHCTKLVGDGDAAVLDAIKTLDPYGGKLVEKEECINHVSKNMFKGLDRLTKEVDSQAKGQGVDRMSGRGKMTKDRMKKWSSYNRKMKWMLV